MFVRILPILLILIFRFLGLFIVLPVISLYVARMEGANMLNVGLAIGAPYLFQMLFQPFFGRLSDRYGRKNILIIGLFVFLIGSLVCMMEDSIYHLIIGRCIQGMGAIGGLLTALVADSVREEKRTGAMALMGVGIFISFILAIILGAILGARYGFNSLFLLTAVTTFASILIAIFCVPQSEKIKFVYIDSNDSLERDMKLGIFALSLSSFIEKFLMILTFVLIPIILHTMISEHDFWHVYAPAIVVGILILAKVPRFMEI